MTIQFKEGDLYKISHDYYNDIKLTCTYVEDNTVWFMSKTIASHGFDAHGPYTTKDSTDHYKLNRKTNKLYKLNEQFSSYDLIENTLSEYKSDVWDRTGVHRQGDPSGYYSETGQGE